MNQMLSDPMMTDASSDIVDVETNRERELAKLRCNSASPSTLSTASSGSPLVRGSSGSSHAPRRPAPTSIAAAQLQCQQHHLDFTNKISSGKSHGNSSKKSSNKHHQLKSPHSSEVEKPAKSANENGAKKAKDFYSFADSSSSNSGGSDDGKSPGYKMAKSIAFKAYRFNQFWSVNKIRYMNLACLLMTIACLLTIIIYNWNQSPSQQQAALSSHSQSQVNSETIAKLNRIKAALDSNNNNEPLVEPIESLPDSSQALVSGKSQVPPDSTVFDDSAQDPTGPPAKKCLKCKESKSRRKSDLPDEPEIEDLDQSQDQRKSLVTKELERLFSDSFGGLAASSGFESLMKQIERIASAANSGGANNTSGSGLSMLSVKPIRNKNGKAAGIVVSANIGENGTTRQLNDSTLPLPNFERLFPSILRPATLMSMSGSPLLSMLMSKHNRPSQDDELSSNGTNNGPIATITIGGSMSEPMPLLAPLTSHLMRSFAPPGAHLPDSFLVGSSSGPRPSFMDQQPPPSGIFRPFSSGPPSIFGPTPFMSLPPMLPPPGLLSMLLRGGPEGDEGDQAPMVSTGRIKIKSAVPKAAASSSPAESQQPAASQQSTQTVTTSSPRNQVMNDSEVEILDQATLNRGGPFHNLYSRRSPTPQGSMLIINSASESPSPATLGPFGLMAPPMMFVGSSRGPLVGAHGPMNPMLRAILSNVMSEISSDLEQQAGKQNKTSQTRRSFSSPANGGSEMDDEWEASERWDEQQQAGNPNKKREMRARHRDLNSLETDLTEAADERAAAELMGSFQAMEQGNDPSESVLGHHQAGAVIGGSIRQTIRGPGLSVERIIDIPSGRLHQQVAPGIKSQSLSIRGDSGENGEISSANEQSQQTQTSSNSGHKSPFLSSAANTLLFGPSLRPATIERLDEAPFPPPVGFIGRLLSDLSRRAAEHHQQAQRRENSQQRSSSGGPGGLHHLASASSTLDEDLDEGDSEELSAPGARFTAGPAQPWPRLRLASARIRMGPIIAAEPRSSSVDGSQQPQQQHEGFFLPSGQFAEMGTENGVGEMPPQEFHQHQQPRFEDTLNSMEDRLNHVLIMNGIKSPAMDSSDEIPQIPMAANRLMGAPSMQQAEIAHRSSTPTPAAPKMSAPPAPPATSQPTKQVADQNSKTKALASNNQKPAGNGAPPSEAFTSPDSPLFGFPATSGDRQQSDKESGANKPGGNRQQRSFTYHSNNEVAGQFQQQQGKPMEREDSQVSARARLLPLMAPPTGAIMGRRLDESFEGESQSVEPNQQAHQTAGLEARQARGENGNQNYWMWP